MLYIASFATKGVVYGTAVVHSFQNKLPLILQYKKGNNFDGNSRSEVDHEDDMAKTSMNGHEYFFIHLFVDKDFEVLAEASPTVRAVVCFSSGRALRYEERETTASNRLLL